MDEHNLNNYNDRESDRPRDDADLSGRTMSRHTDSDRDQFAPTDPAREYRTDDIDEHGGVGTGLDTGKYSSQLDTADSSYESTSTTGNRAYDEESLGETGHSHFDDAMGGGHKGYDSAETRFGVENPGQHGYAESTDPDRLATEHDRPAFGRDQFGSDEYHSSDTTDVDLDKSTHSAGYGESAGHSFSGSETTGYKDDSSTGSDSTMGKLMENAGNMLSKEDLAEKGREKREAAGYEHEGGQSDY